MRTLILLAPLLSACGQPDRAASPVRFTDVTDDAGLDFVHHTGATGHYYYPETYGSGAGFLDYDGDGWMDIYLVNGAPLGTGTRTAVATPPVNRLYRNNRDGTFTDVTTLSGAGDTGYGMGCAAGDYNNNGHQDLYVANFGPNTLLRNDGDGTFTDVTTQLGVGDARWASSCGFLVFNRNGKLDLFVVNYVEYSLDANPVCQKGSLRSYCDPDVFAPIGDVLYRNDGDRFVDVTAKVGLNLKGRGLGVAFFDHNENGYTDIYVANDGTQNFLYENVGGQFQDRSLQSGTRFNMEGRAEAGMGVDFGDFANNGLFDIVVGNFAYETTTLYQSVGDGHYIDASERLGIGATTYMPLTFGVKFIDYDNDGFLDILATNGHVLDNIEQVDPAHTYAQSSQMLRNLAGQRFKDISGMLSADFTAPSVARGTAVGDYDNDGDIDVLINTTSGRPRLLRNDGGSRQQWLIVSLVGTQPRDALGARVVLRADGMTQKRQRQSGGSYLATHDPRLHFGLGNVTAADVEIIWPDGIVDRFINVQANRILRVARVTQHPDHE